ncbi:MAG: hypothetical protein MZW92_11000 [Comamonadaceae bacterium]|nr:hypothetical protein [Comamonadaceae bacterium]
MTFERQRRGIFGDLGPAAVAAAVPRPLLHVAVLGGSDSDWRFLRLEKGRERCRSRDRVTRFHRSRRFADRGDLLAAAGG